MKKLLSLVLALCLALGLCAVSAQADAAQVQLTYWAPVNSALTSVISSLDDNLCMQLLQESTGIDLVFQHPAVGQEREQFNLLIASRDLPDIIEYDWTSYAGGVQKAVDDGVIIPLNDYMEEYAPNYSKFFEDYPAIAKQVKTDDGTICVFASLSISEYNCQGGFIARQDWLDELGVESFRTIDEWEEVMLKLIDEKDLECGIALNFNNLRDRMIGAWNISSGYFVDNGVVKYGPMEPEFADFIATMARWYDNGILDPDFAASDTTTLDSYMLEGETAMTFGFAGGTLGGLYTSAEAKGMTDFCPKGVPYPTVTGEPSYFTNVSWEYRGSQSAAVTTQCEDIKSAFTVLDYFFSDEGRLAKSFGKEGVSFTFVDGEPIYTDEVTHNADGLSMQQVLAKYTRAAYPCVGMIETGYHEQYFVRPVQKESVKIWNEYKDLAYEKMMPRVSMTTEEASELATMNSLINDYRDEMMVKFIMGQEPLDNLSKFTEQLKNLGVERAIEIYQAAYDRYQAR